MLNEDQIPEGYMQNAQGVPRAARQYPPDRH